MEQELTATEDDLFTDEVFLKVAAMFETAGGFFDSTWMTDHEWNLWRSAILIERERGVPLPTVVNHAASRAARSVLYGMDSINDDLGDYYFWVRELANQWTDDDLLWSGVGEVA